MKRLLTRLRLPMICCCIALPTTINSQQQPALKGAWTLRQDNKEHLLLVTNRYYTYTVFSVADKKFYHSEGGTWTQVSDKMQVQSEFNTTDKTLAGKKDAYGISLKKDKLDADISGSQQSWSRIDDGNGPLNATWRITDREQNGQLYAIPKAARKTIKILTGTRFQWVAINTDTGEFFGTGGGAYSFTDGRYTEKIEFFSRDASRVGIELSFEGAVKDNQWHHKGKSSKGDPIYEIWSKED